MREWIRKRMGGREPVRIIVLKSFTSLKPPDELLEARVIEVHPPGRSIDRRVELRAYVDDLDDWCHVAEVSAEDAGAFAKLLAEADEFFAGSRGSRRLSTVTMCCSQYFIDERLKELRNVDNPHDRIVFDEN
jgi:hypothetical protein